MSDYLIREADLQDLEAITALWRQLSYDQLSKDEYYTGDFDFEGNEETIQNALDSRECAIFVAVVDQRIVGYAEVWLYNKDFHFFIADYAYVLHFFVEPAVRRQRSIWSLVYRLYDACERWATARGRKYLVADAFAHNQRIMRIMERLGLKNYRSRFVKPLQVAKS
jgi:RimJ/RimL family protein N-acetyltransferase